MNSRNFGEIWNQAFWISSQVPGTWCFNGRPQFQYFYPKIQENVIQDLYCMIMKNKTEFRFGCSGTLIPMYVASFCLLSKSILFFISFVGLSIIRNLDFKYFRAKIERENKDIRLEKIRVKAAEQRETVLQSIKWVRGLWHCCKCTLSGNISHGIIYMYISVIISPQTKYEQRKVIHVFM